MTMKNLFAILSFVLASLASFSASAQQSAVFSARPKAAGGVIQTSEGDLVEIRIGIPVGCGDYNPDLFGISPDPGGQLGGCVQHPDDTGVSKINYVFSSPQGEQAYKVQYGPWFRDYKVVGSAKLDPSGFVQRDEYDDHVGDFEDHESSSSHMDNGTVQVLAQLGGMPNDSFTQRPTFLARALVNVALVREGSHGFVLGILGGYGRTNFNVSPAFDSLTEEAPVDIGEFALMPQYSLRPKSVGWIQWNIGVPLGLRYYSYEAQVLSMDPGNPDALANNDRQFAFWLGAHTDFQFIIAKYLSVGPWAQFSLNVPGVDVNVGDGMDNKKLMPQFSGGGLIGADF